MSDEFVRSGPLMKLSSYPQWAQEMVHNCEDAKQRVVNHKLFHLMRDVKLDERATRNFMVGVWPVIEQFPQYMALNLLKLQYGRTRGHDMARKYLIQNIRIEQNHADHWVDWAVASGVSREELIYGSVPLATHALSHWCWHTCNRDTLAASMAATNYAIEGATGEWSALICSNNSYENAFDPGVRKKAMKWLKVHAQYDDTHPWEALEIICSIMGGNPTARGIALLSSCIRTSYEYMQLTLDYCLLPDAVGNKEISPTLLIDQQRKRAA
jgi:pyrroloquinoline quinone (PQQ) biosynthesis protein C